MFPWSHYNFDQEQLVDLAKGCNYLRQYLGTAGKLFNEQGAASLITDLGYNWQRSPAIPKSEAER